MLGRFMHFLFAVFFLAASLSLVLISIGWTTPLEILSAANTMKEVRAVFGITGGIMVIISLYIFLVSLFRNPAQHVVIEDSAVGEINISFKAIENIILQVAQGIHGVRNIKPIIRTTSKGVYIYLKAIVAPDTNISEVSKTLQDKVKEVLEESAGIKIVEVRITVVDINYEEKMRVH